MKRTTLAVLSSLVLAACGGTSSGTPGDRTLLDGTFTPWGGLYASSADSRPANWEASPADAWGNSLKPLESPYQTGGILLVPGASVTLTNSQTVAVTPGQAIHAILDARPEADKADGASVTLAVDWLDEGCQETLDTATLTSTTKASDNASTTVGELTVPSVGHCARLRIIANGGSTGAYLFGASLQYPR